MRRASQGILLSLILAVTARAQAQEEDAGAGFGEKGHFAIAADRLFGYVHVSQDTTSPAGTTTDTFSSISLLGSPVSTFVSFYTVPRIGFDAFIAPSISLGGSLTYFHISTSGTGGTTTTTLSGILAAPRLGYAARLAPAVWLWPRAGVTYVRAWESQNTLSLLAATVEAQLVLALVPHALFLIGPTVDVGLTGSSSANNVPIAAGSTSVDVKETDYGLQAGLVLYF